MEAATSSDGQPATPERSWRYRTALVGPSELDEPFIYHSWLSSYRSSHRVGKPSSDVYYRAHHPLVGATLARSQVQVIAAHLPGEDRHMLGWICWEPAGRLIVVHYIYVKAHFRHRGVARGLAKQAGIEPASEVLYTWDSKQARYLARKVDCAEYVSAAEFLAMGQQDASNPNLGATHG